MARQNINIGTVANDGTGDPLRTAFDKVNDNFIELYDLMPSDISDLTDTGNLLFDGDYESLTNTPDISSFVVLDDGFVTDDVKGSVYGQDGTLLVDTENNRINTDRIVNPANTLVIDAGFGFSLQTDDDIQLVAGDEVRVYSGNRVVIETEDNTGSHFWFFRSDGALAFPDGTVQETAFTPSNITLSGNEISSVGNIEINSDDDIIISSSDKLAAAVEGGDINIYAGKGGTADTSLVGGTGGDIEIIAGQGGDASTLNIGGTGGYVLVKGGQGSEAIASENIQALPGGIVEILGGDAGSNDGDNTLGSTGGKVLIVGGQSTQTGSRGGDIELRSGQGVEDFGSVLISADGGFSYWEFESGGDLITQGSIIPSIDITYDLGSPTKQWRSLYVSGNTIFIGGTPISVDAGGNLIVDGNEISGSANTGDVTFDGVKIIGAGTASGDGNGYSTLELVPDSSLYANDQYLVIDPTSPTHIHIRGGGTQDASQSELFLGGEANYVRVADSSGVRLQNQTRNDLFYSYLDPTDFNTGTWYESGGTYFVQYTTSNSELQTVTFQFNNDNENTLRVYYNGGASNSLLTSAGSISNLGGGVYRVSVNEAPPTSPTSISEFEYTIWETRTNSLQLQSNDFTVTVTDDIRITGNDTFSLRNTSTTEPITINTDYDGSAYAWEFGADGTLQAPGDMVVAGDITGTASASTLVLGAEPNSNTYIQLNDTVDSIISTVANLEIITDASNTPKTWAFDTSGGLTFPDSTTQTTAYPGFDQDLNSTDSPNFVNIGLAGITPPGNTTPYATIGIAENSDLYISLSATEIGSKVFEFGSDGRLIVPGTLYVDGNVYGGAGDRLYLAGDIGEGVPAINIPNSTEGATSPLSINNTQGGGVQIETGAGNWLFDDARLLYFPTSSDDEYNIGESVDGFNVRSDATFGIVTDASNTAYTWVFGNDGLLTFPDTTIQTTAFTLSPTLNVLKIDDGVHEKFQPLADAANTVTHDCSEGHIFYHTSPDDDWTVNLTNLNLASGYATTVTIVIVQGGTGYYPSALEIGGSAQTINWQGNTTPTPSTNRTDVVSFSIINNSGTYTVLGQLTGF